MEQRKVCENCLHWEPENNQRERGECMLVQSIDGKQIAPGTRAYAYDVGAQQAGLITAPEFGCNQHEQDEA